MMRLTQDPNHDVCYLTLVEDVQSYRTIRVRPGLLLDLDEEERLIGIEFLGHAFVHPDLRSLMTPPTLADVLTRSVKEIKRKKKAKM